MQTVKNWPATDFTAGRRRRLLLQAGDSMLDPLMRSAVVVIVQVLSKRRAEMIFVQDDSAAANFVPTHGPLASGNGNARRPRTVITGESTAPLGSPCRAVRRGERGPALEDSRTGST